MKRIFGLLVALTMLMGANGVLAQTGSSDGHALSVEVQAFDSITLGGTPPSFVITAEGEATDTGSTIAWATNETTRTITVQSSLTAAAIDYAVTVEATNPVTSDGATPGTPAGAVTIPGSDESAAAFITTISQSSASATLEYVVDISVTDPTGTDSHTITYTFTADS
ncbi:MAG: hypothetical protein WD314_09340 [Trueperaceae bacterium]